MTFDDLTDEELAEYEEAANEKLAELERERQSCDHDNRTFHEVEVGGRMEPMSTCDNCTDVLVNEEAEKAHDV